MRPGCPRPPAPSPLRALLFTQCRVSTAVQHGSAAAQTHVADDASPAELRSRTRADGRPATVSAFEVRGTPTAFGHARSLVSTLKCFRLTGSALFVHGVAWVRRPRLVACSTPPCRCCLPRAALAPWCPPSAAAQCRPPVSSARPPVDSAVVVATFVDADVAAVQPRCQPILPRRCERVRTAGLVCLRSKLPTHSEAAAASRRRPSTPVASCRWGRARLDSLSRAQEFVPGVAAQGPSD